RDISNRSRLSRRSFAPHPNPLPACGEREGPARSVRVRGRDGVSPSGRKSLRSLRVLCASFATFALKRFLSQPQPAGDDAAQDLAGAALDRQLGGDQRRLAQRFLEAVVVALWRRIP